MVNCKITFIWGRENKLLFIISIFLAVFPCLYSCDFEVYWIVPNLERDYTDGIFMKAEWYLESCLELFFPPGLDWKNLQVKPV